MVDSIARLQNMKGFMRGVGEHWGCRAGQNWLIIRTDGTLAPCFPVYNATYDWGKPSADGNPSITPFASRKSQANRRTQKSPPR